MTDGKNAKPRVIRHSRGKRPKFSHVGGVDQLMSMVLVLASELCVTRDRIDAIERVSALKGLDLAADIENLTLDQAALEAREARRQDLFGAALLPDAQGSRRAHLRRHRRALQGNHR